MLSNCNSQAAGQICRGTYETGWERPKARCVFFCWRFRRGFSTSKTGLSITDAQIEQMLAGGPCSLNENVRQIVREQGRSYTERLLSAVLEAGFDYKALPVIMLGGGAAIVSRQIQPNTNLCRLAALPDDKLNAIGYERILAQMSPRVGQS